MILITGGTGFLGKKLIDRFNDKSILRIVSRNEGKLIELKEEFPEIEIFPGDISDKVTCSMALKNIDEVYHLAAFKHVTMAEKRARECCLTNIVGTLNLLDVFRGKLFLTISTDKAAQVNGVYGASKMVMERVIQEYENNFHSTTYRVVRYGNVLYSTGSVLCKWKKLIEEDKEIILTSPDATRFFWTVDQAVDLIFDCIYNAPNSKPYCPSMKSIKISSLLTAMYEKYGKEKQKMKFKVIGLQPGENLHEKVLDNGLYSDETEQYTIKEIKELI